MSSEVEQMNSDTPDNESYQKELEEIAQRRAEREKRKAERAKLGLTL